MAFDLTTRRCTAGAAWGLLALCTGAHALGPAAPFTPPRAASSPTADMSSTSSAGASTSSTTAATASGAEGLAGLRLGNQPMALIDGQWWRAGDRPRGALLASLGITGAVLRHTDGRLEHLPWAPAAGVTISPKTTSTTR